MATTNIIGNLLVFKIIRLLSSSYNKWSYYKNGIIDENGVVIDSDRSTKFLHFVINIKKLISFHPMGKLKLSSLPLALSLMRESLDTDSININEELLTEQLIKYGFIEQ